MDDSRRLYRDVRTELLRRAVRALQELPPDGGPVPAGDPDPALMDGLARLVAADPDDEQAAVALGRLHWWRHLRHGAQEDLDEAVRLLAPQFLPDRLYLVPEGLRTEIADSYATHVASQVADVLALGGDVDGNLSGLARWCWFLLDHADPGNARYGVHLVGLGSVLYERYNTLGDAGALLQGIGLLSRAVRVTPAGHETGHAARANLAIALARRHGLTGSAGDLRAAFEACGAALDAPLPPEHREAMAGLLLSLLAERVGRARDEHRWDELAAAGRAVLDHPGLRAYGHEAVAESLEHRFREGGDVADLDESIGQWTALAAAFPDSHGAPQRAYCLLRLGHAHWLRFEHDARPGDLDAVVDANERALALVPGDVSLRWEVLRKLGVALLERVDRKVTAGDVERAVAVIREGLADRDGHRAPPHLRAVLTRALPRALWSRYTLTRRAEDLAETAELLRSAAVREAPSPGAVLLFGALATQVHRARYRAGQGLGALHESVAAGRAALAAVPEDHAGRPEVLVQLVLSLGALFQHTAELPVLDEAVDLGREAVRAVGDDAPDGPGAVNARYVLGTALAERGARTGGLDDLDEAVRTLRHLHSSGAPLTSRDLHGLGFALAQRSERTGDRAELDEAVTLLRGAAEDCDEEEAIVLSGLSSALLRRYRLGGGPDDLDEALVVARRAADAAGEHDPGALPTLSALVAALIEERHRRPGQVDADELVALCRRLIDLAPPGHAALGAFHHNLGIARKERADALEPDELHTMFSTLTGRPVIPFTMVEAVNDLTTAARSESLPPSQRVRSAWAAGLTLVPLDVLWAHDLLEYAVGLIPLVAPRRIARVDQQHAVKNLSDLVTFTAAVALDAGEQRHPDLRHLPLLPDAWPRALRSVELGRAVLLSQRLETRGDISELRRRHPVLADRFVRLRDTLDGEGGEESEDRKSSGAPDRPRAAAELTATIDEIRALEGFDSFARPPDTASLLATAEEGPVVVFTCNPARCDALLVTGGGVRHLPLPGLVYAELAAQADLFHRTLTVAGDPDGDWRTQKEAQRTLSGILGWLWDVAAEPVLTALRIGPGSGDGGDPPRVWWSPGGLLGSLPLHAAGHHAESVAGRGDRTVLDRVVSSYTPTIRALRHARRPRAAGGGPGRSLIVSMPDTPGAPPLAGAAEEAAAVAAVLPDPVILSGATTRTAVLAALAGARFVHLACHAVTDAADPSLGRLLLGDHLTRPLTVAGVAAVALDGAELAYLSACRTTYTAAADLLDEAIHLTSAFQLAGFRHVVGTLWEADDEMSGRIADGFYRALSGPGGLDCARSAAALRTSVLALRDDFPGTPSLWAGHLHAGA
ncbi:CHAT domain-containing protein [Streptomyces ficellus]|uniref:CHAT domain-containing protein n=1 Tax=Streptomyces ficellus TaxID=1977088 RepID=A0A6I6F3X5_9ACTN|nr:CHAT domain-containing protein [Streptomyces ficellus]